MLSSPTPPPPPGLSSCLTLPCPEQPAPHTALLRRRGEQHSPEQGCSSWMTCNGCLYISPLCLLFPFFFSYLPTPQTTDVFVCSFPQQTLNSESTALTTAKERRTRGIWHSPKAEAKTRVFFPLIQASRWSQVKLVALFTFPTTCPVLKSFSASGCGCIFDLFYGWCLRKTI